jgi:hypothetical protein
VYQGKALILLAKILKDLSLSFAHYLVQFSEAVASDMHVSHSKRLILLALILKELRFACESFNGPGHDGCRVFCSLFQL